MRLKSGVKLTDLQPQVILAVLAVEEVMGFCTVTSANDSKHSASSWHYKGRALDFRTKDYAGDKLKAVADIKERLGPDFDVVLEAEGEPNEHLHVEYDPK